MKKKKNKKKKSKVNKFIYTTMLILSIILLIMITVLNIIPSKFLIPIYIVIFIFNIIMYFLMLKKQSKTSSIMAFIFIIIVIIGIYYLNATNNFLSYFNKDNYKTENFLILVLKESTYQKLEDLKDLDIGYVKNEITSINKALDKVNKKIKIKNLEYENYNLIFDEILNNKLTSTLIEESNYTLLLEENEQYNDKFRIIDEIKITTKIDNKNKNVDVTKDTFNIFISGIDNYGEISSVGRSDVNMILTINPKTKQVLMTSIPRDYYVQLHNTEGYKDKLTHAGLYGTEMSVNTIEDLLDIDINYYFRVNFTTLEKIIDAIDGVDVYSKYSFVSYIGNYQFYKGYNHMNGQQALGFARERKTLPQGDISRAENQQAVIDGIIRKLTNVTSITKYNNIINSLENSFQTNMTDKDITSLIKMQLNDNAKWNITSNVLNGTGANDYTYSYKGQKLYVMIPNNESVNEGKNLIKKVSEDTLLESSYDDNATNIKNPNKVDNSNNEEEKEEQQEETKEEVKEDVTIEKEEKQDENEQIEDNTNNIEENNPNTENNNNENENKPSKEENNNEQDVNEPNIDNTAPKEEENDTNEEDNANNDNTIKEPTE